MDRQKADRRISCPSSQPDTQDSVVFGVVVGPPGARQVGYLNEQRPADPVTLALSGPVRPTEIFRIAGPCAKSSCKHFAGNACSLAEAPQAIAYVEDGHARGKVVITV